MLVKRSMPATEARTSLPAILKQVEAGDEVTITRHGRPVAVVVPPDLLRRRRLLPSFVRTARFLADLEQDRADPISYEDFLKLPGGYTEEEAEEHVQEIYADRHRSSDGDD